VTRVKPPFVIFDIRAFWRSAWASECECPDVKNYKWSLTRSTVQDIFSCTRAKMHIGLKILYWRTLCSRSNLHRCVRFQAAVSEAGGTEAGRWSPWQPSVVVLVAGVSISLFVVLCVAIVVVVCRCCVHRTHLPTRTNFKRSVIWTNTIVSVGLSLSWELGVALVGFDMVSF